MTKRFGLPERAITQLCAVFGRYPQIEIVTLYGSRAKDTYRPGSDIDLTLKGRGLDLSMLLAIEADIDDLLLAWMVDLSLYQHIDNPNLMEHIERVGVPFCAQE